MLFFLAVAFADPYIFTNTPPEYKLHMTDQRAATTLGLSLRTDLGVQIGRCWTTRTQHPHRVGLQLEVRIERNGSLRKTKIRQRSGFSDVDRCVAEVFSSGSTGKVPHPARGTLEVLMPRPPSDPATPVDRTANIKKYTLESGLTYLIRHTSRPSGTLTAIYSDHVDTRIVDSSDPTAIAQILTEWAQTTDLRGVALTTKLSVGDTSNLVKRNLSDAPVSKRRAKRRKAKKFTVHAINPSDQPVLLLEYRFPTIPPKGTHGAKRKQHVDELLVRLIDARLRALQSTNILYADAQMNDWDSTERALNVRVELRSESGVQEVLTELQRMTLGFEPQEIVGAQLSLITTDALPKTANGTHAEMVRILTHGEIVPDPEYAELMAEKWIPFLTVSELNEQWRAYIQSPTITLYSDDWSEAKLADVYKNVSESTLEPWDTHHQDLPTDPLGVTKRVEDCTLYVEEQAEKQPDFSGESDADMPDDDEPMMHESKGRMGNLNRPWRERYSPKCLKKAIISPAPIPSWPQRTQFLRPDLRLRQYPNGAQVLIQDQPDEELSITLFRHRRNDLSAQLAQFVAIASGTNGYALAHLLNEVGATQSEDTPNRLEPISTPSHDALAMTVVPGHLNESLMWLHSIIQQPELKEWGLTMGRQHVEYEVDPVDNRDALQRFALWTALYGDSSVPVITAASFDGVTTTSLEPALPTAFTPASDWVLYIRGALPPEDQLLLALDQWWGSMPARPAPSDPPAPIIQTSSNDVSTELRYQRESDIQVFYHLQTPYSSAVDQHLHAISQALNDRIRPLSNRTELLATDVKWMSGAQTHGGIWVDFRCKEGTEDEILSLIDAELSHTLSTTLPAEVEHSPSTTPVERLEKGWISLVSPPVSPQDEPTPPISEEDLVRLVVRRIPRR